MRMTKTIGAIATIAGLTLAAPALAADAYSSFTASTNGAGGFTYGSTDGTAFTPFTPNANPCVITGTTCLQRSTVNSQGTYLPGVYDNSGAAFKFGSVNVPANSLVLHPGPDTFGGPNLESIYVAFTAPTAATYAYTALFAAVDDTPSGVGVTSFTLPAGSAASLDGTNSFTGGSYATSGTVGLAAGDIFGFILDKGSVYYNDSTSLSFQVAAVPEPATWGLMILGFGMAGAGLRRSRRRDVALAA